jgi:hypothetical protein
VSPLIPWTANVLGGFLVVPIAAVVIIFGLGFIVFHRLSPMFGEAL